MLYKTIEWLSRADYRESQRSTRFGSVVQMIRTEVHNNQWIEGILHPGQIDLVDS
jgi:hypothetical protein